MLTTLNLYLFCRAYSQIIMQAIFHRFPEVLDDDCSAELSAVARFLDLSPSMKKLQNLKSIALREVEPATARQPAQIFAEV